MKFCVSLFGMLPLTLFAKSSHPNIIYIMCDDMGYGDLGCYGQRLIATPCIDRMAAEGMLFTDAYAGCPVSAPSRCSFMTGQHTGHAKIRGNREYWGRSVLRQNMFGENADYYVVGQEPYDMTHPIFSRRRATIPACSESGLEAIGTSTFLTLMPVFQMETRIQAGAGKVRRALCPT